MAHTIEAEIDELTVELGLSPVAKTKILAEYHATHGGKGIAGTMKRAFGIMDMAKG